MTTPQRFLFSGMIAFFSLALLACPSATTIVNYINDALQIAITAASATGTLPPAYVSYVNAGLGCIDFAATEMASATDSDAAKSAAITAKCAMLTSVAMPAGTAQNYVNAAAALAKSISDILSHLPTAPAPVVAGGKTGADKPTFTPISDKDHATLIGISTRAKAAQTKLKL